MDTELEYQSLTVRKIRWRDRLIRNAWRAPFPYLLHTWEVTIQSPDGGGYCISGRKGKVSRWLAEWRDADWADFNAAFPESAYENYRDSAPPAVPVPWLVAADSDKNWRCPACGTAGGLQCQLEIDGWKLRPWFVYECREYYFSSYEGGGLRQGCGQRFARRGLLLPELEGWHVLRRVRSYIRYHVPARLLTRLTSAGARAEAWWTWEVQFRLSDRTKKEARHARS